MIKVIVLFTLLISSTVLAQESEIPKHHRRLFSKDGTYVYLQPGTVWDHMVASGTLSHLHFNKSNQKFIAFGVDFGIGAELDEIFDGIILRLEAQYKTFDFNATGINNDKNELYNLKGAGFLPTFSFLYRIPWRWKLQPYAGAGTGMVWNNIYRNVLVRFKNDSSSTVKDRPWTIYDDDYTGMLTMGLMYDDRIDINLRIINTTWTDWGENFGLKSRSFIISAGYRF